jgi:DNA-binding XRE family transcriptional regulator
MSSDSALDKMSSRIMRLRVKQGLSQAALAELLNVDQATVSRWERGQQMPTRALQLRLIALFDGVAETGHYRPELDFVRHSPFPMVAFDRNRRVHATSSTFPGAAVPPPYPTNIGPHLHSAATRLNGARAAGSALGEAPRAILHTSDMNAAVAAAEDERFFSVGSRAARVIGRIQELNGAFDYADQIWAAFHQAGGAVMIVAQMVFLQFGEFTQRRDRFGLFRLLD